jgi:short subunit dehydrogenase-like uncharacterized protein
VIQAPGFDGLRTVRRAAKVSKGPQKGKFELHLVDANGEVGIADFAPDENVTVVGHQEGKKKGEPTAKMSKGKKPAKGAAKKPAAEKPEPTAKTDAKPKAGKKAKAKPDAGDKKLSAINAAYKVLAETGKAMNCQELITAMTEKKIWSSPGGLTPHATLYSAILRELKAKGESRFRKVEKGKFSAKTA